MANIFFRETFALENMAEMSSAIRAEDLGSRSVWFPPYGPFDFIVETGPAAIRIELISGTIQRCVALATNVSSFDFVVEEFAATRHLCPFVQDDASFVWR